MDPIEITLHVDEGWDMPTTVTPLGDGRYRMEETVEFCRRASLGCVVGLRQREDGTYKIWKVFERPYRVKTFMIPNNFANSHALYELGEWVYSLGGRWECIMEGKLLLHIPHDVNVDLLTEIQRRIDVFESAGGLSAPHEVAWLQTHEPWPPGRPES
jgi:hypothetical protein